MNYIKLKITSTLMVLLLIVMASCDTISGDPELPIPLDETLNNTGAFLRVLSVESSGFDVADLATASYSFTGEISDVEGGETIVDIRFFASYTATGEPSPPTVPEANTPVTSVDPSSLEIDEDSGLPRGTFTVLLQDILANLNLSISDLSLGDRFNVRWELETEDGTVYSAEDASPALGGGFYRSPYNANASVIQSVPQDLFVGEYTITQNNVGSGSFLDPIWGSDTVTGTLQIDPANGLNGRVVDLNYLGSFARTLKLTFFRRQDFQSFTAADNWVSVPQPALSLRVGCSAIGLSLGSVPNASITSFDVDDDSQFTFAVIDNVDGDCGLSPEQVTFTATKN